MALTYNKLSKNPYSFLKITGLTVQEFGKVIINLENIWIEKVEKLKKQAGRNSHIRTLEDKVLCLCMYYRTYITHTFLGWLFNLDNSNISRLFQKLEPLLAKKLCIKKDRTMTKEEVLKIIADVMEQPINRPKKKQKKSYSGKKKRHTIKSEIVMAEDGRILSVSKSYKGRMHDFKIRKSERPLSRNAIKYADSGYQGWQKLQSNVVIPYKRSKKKPLTEDQILHNKQLASFRIRIEHKIRQLKVFKILSDVYRNFQRKHNMRLNIIAGIVNLKCAH
jgi:hypothetical protein